MCSYSPFQGGMTPFGPAEVQGPPFAEDTVLSTSLLDGTKLFLFPHFCLLTSIIGISM